MLNRNNLGFLIRWTGYMSGSRNTVVVTRTHTPPYYPKGTSEERMKEMTYEVPDDYYQTYRLDQRETKSSNIEIILLKSLAEFGPRGSVISVPSSLARQRLLLPKLAVYKSPENLIRYSEILLSSDVKIKSSESAVETVKKLSKTVLVVLLHSQNHWTIDKMIISTSFQRQGFTVPEDCIELHPKEISGPNLENDLKEFYVTVTINSFERVSVRCLLRHYDPLETGFEFPEGYAFKFHEPLFPEDTEFLYNLPRAPFTTKEKENSALVKDYEKYKEWFYIQEQKFVFKES